MIDVKYGCLDKIKNNTDIDWTMIEIILIIFRNLLLSIKFNINSNNPNKVKTLKANMYIIFILFLYCFPYYYNLIVKQNKILLLFFDHIVEKKYIKHSSYLISYILNY